MTTVPEPKPFEPSTGNLDEAGAPPVTPNTDVMGLSPETVAAFQARATEAAIRTDLREKLLGILKIVGEIATQKFLGL
jgi:hypothetical protein